jgi:hypothetical protein
VIQDSEIVGNDVERRVDDPAVRISGGDLTLERCAISGKEPGTVRIESRGIARIDHCEISTDSRGAAVIIETTAGRVPVLGCTIHGGIEIGVAGSALLESCDIDAPKGYAGVNVASGGLVDIEDTQVHDVAGRGVVVTGVAMMSNCEVRTTGEGAIVVLSDGTLKAVDCKVLESGTSTRQWVGRRLGTLGERVKERTDRLLAPAVAILVATGGTGHFVRCSISEERTAAVEADGTVTFEECTLNNAPYLTRDEPTEAEENAARPT